MIAVIRALKYLSTFRHYQLAVLIDGWITDLSQVVALSALAGALDKTSDEAADLLPRMIQAYKDQKPLPRRNSSVMSQVCASMSFVENGEPQFLTLAHLDDDGQVSYLTQETLVWIALDATTCEALQYNVCGAERTQGFFGRFRDKLAPAADKAITTESIHMLMRNTQNIGIRAAFLANFVRHAIEHIARTTPANVFEGSKESAERHLKSYQRQVERIAPSFVDSDAAIDIIKAMSMPFTPIIMSQVEDDSCEKLNGIPMTKDHTSAWRNYFGKVQGVART